MECELFVLDHVAEVGHRFEKELGREDLNQSGVRFNRLFSKMMDDFERLSLNPFMDYEDKFPEE